MIRMGTYNCHIWVNIGYVVSLIEQLLSKPRLSSIKTCKRTSSIWESKRDDMKEVISVVLLLCLFHGM